MQFLGAIIIVAVAILIGILFYHIFRIKGPWGSLWTFVLILVVAGLAAAAWVDPVGPVYRDVAWIPVFFVTLLFALFLAAATPAVRERDPADSENQGSGTSRNNTPEVALSAFFWLFIVMMLFFALWGAVR